ncbi:MAG: anti-sigma factor family protein [Candidatus Rokuibacteriota bacterium]
MANHLETDLVPYVRGELDPAERERVARHLDECADCRQDADDLRELLSKLALSAPPAPAIHWGRYRAELGEKLEARRARRAWWGRPLPLVLSAGLAGLLLVFAVWGGRQSGSGVDLVTLEEAVIGGRLGLLQQYAVVERLDLLEELEVIRNLDRLTGARDG